MADKQKAGYEVSSVRLLQTGLMWILSQKYLCVTVTLSNTDRRKNSLFSLMEVLTPPDKVCEKLSSNQFIPYNMIPHTR